MIIILSAFIFQLHLSLVLSSRVANKYANLYGIPVAFLNSTYYLCLPPLPFPAPPWSDPFSSRNLGHASVRSVRPEKTRKNTLETLSSSARSAEGSGTCALCTTTRDIWYSYISVERHAISTNSTGGTSDPRHAVTTRRFVNVKWEFHSRIARRNRDGRKS